MMYLLYMTVKYTLHWMVIIFKDCGDVVHNSVSSTYCTIAIYEGTLFFVASLFTYTIPATSLAP